MKRNLFCLLLLLPLLGYAVSKAEEKPSIVVFGDSLSDAGYYNNLPNVWQTFLAGDPWPLMHDEATPKEPTFSTPVKNAIWVQQLGVLGLTKINKLNNLNTIPSNINTTKAVVEIINPLPSNSIYAAGGATTLCNGLPSPANNQGQGIYMAPPIGPLQPGKGGSVDICPLGSHDINSYNQIDSYLKNIDTSKKLLEQNIHIIWGGANNAFLLLAQVGAGAISPEQAIQGMAEVAQDIINDVNYLREKGAKNIVVVNLPDLNITPAMTDNGATPESGTAHLAGAMSKAFNSALEAEYPQGSETKLVKADDFFNTIVQDESIKVGDEKFDFSNVTESACDFAGVNSLACTPAADTADFLFADTVHPTAHAHKALAKYIYINGIAKV
ncbi:SGNH/GDSL hydrolase family protein [Francisellaceae bacterium CB300]